MGCLVVLLLLIVPPVVAAKYWPLWAVMLLLLGELCLLLVAVPMLLKRGVTKFAKGMFETKSKVLRGASQVIDLPTSSSPSEDVGRSIT